MKKRLIQTVIIAASLGLSFGIVGCGPNSTDPFVEPSTAVSAVSLNRNELPLAVGGTYTLVATVSPNTALDKTVIWDSSNPEVATVNEYGKVTANAVGSATITVTTNDGNKTATCLVSVTDTPISVTGISLNTDSLTLEVGKSGKLSETLEPSNATNQNVTWGSNDDNVASVLNGNVTAVATGQATITVTAEDGGYNASCLVTVIEDSDDDTYVPDPTDTSILFITSDTVIPTENAYEATINTNYKQIYVNLPDVDVTLNLEGTTIENSENSPIYVKDCDSIDISAKKGTTNFIKDTRPILEQEESNQGKGAIYVANGDLTLKGKGSLSIESSYYNGVHGKDDVEVKNLTLNVTAVHHGIRGNDGVIFDSATVTVLCGGDGVSTKNSDISSKLKQRGDITVEAGTLTIDSWGDAFAAAHDVIINGGTINAKTNKYSSYSGQTVDTSETILYLKMNSSTYASGAYTYAAYINDKWYPATFKKIVEESSGGGGWWAPGGIGPGGGGPGGGSQTSVYYIYEIEKPNFATASSFILYRFSGNNVADFSGAYNAVSETKTFNQSNNMVTITISGSTINFGSWSTYDGISTKGLKAENAITINDGTLDFKVVDDAIHANNDGVLSNGESPLGNVEVKGGVITISTDDDGIHADGALNISGGDITISKSYEGLEGNVISISGGTAKVTASDDGVNASSGKYSASINVSGGYLDVQVPTSGDTDGIDSNGTFTQTGGVVIVKGPGTAGQNAHGAAALDTDSTVRVSGGSLIIFGGYEQTPNYGNLTRTLIGTSSLSGVKTIIFASSSVSYQTTLSYSCRGCIVFSELGSATLS